jgi:hypothetical protein
MAVVKINKGAYENSDAVRNVCQYVCDYRHAMLGFIGGYAVMPDTAILEMMTIKSIYHKLDGKQIHHFEVSFSPKEYISEEDAFILAGQIAQYYGNRFQILYAVHDNTDNLHIHFAMNTVSYIDGHVFSEGPDDFFRFKEYVDYVIGRYINENGIKSKSIHM